MSSSDLENNLFSLRRALLTAKLETSEAFQAWNENAAEGTSFHACVEASDPQLTFEW